MEKEQLEQLEKDLYSLHYLHCLFTDNVIYFKISYEMDSKVIINTFEIL